MVRGGTLVNKTLPMTKKRSKRSPSPTRSPKAKTKTRTHQLKGSIESDSFAIKKNSVVESMQPLRTSFTLSTLFAASATATTVTIRCRLREGS
jgi:negative regulator of replication initiation